MVLRLEVGQARKKSAKGPPGLETARTRARQEERWDQIKRGRKLSSSIMSANLKGDPTVEEPGPKKRTEQKATATQKEEDFSGCSKEPFRLHCRL